MVSPVPAALQRLSPERIVDLDVREDLRAGAEPFAKIMAAVRALPAGSVLRVRAIFEPAPLYRVLAKHGFAHATEELGPEDWRVWFHREEDAREVASPPPSETPSLEALSLEGSDVVVLDVRELEPPEPMVRTLDALTRLPRGKTLVQINARVPQFLLPKLRQRGFVHEIHEHGDVVRVFIRHAEEENRNTETR